VTVASRTRARIETHRVAKIFCNLTFPSSARAQLSTEKVQPFKLN
jgi:hypothetical protein